MAARRVAVVGAGLAGLAAGVALKDAGFEVELFERSRLIGGRATSFSVSGHEVDNGQHIFLGCCHQFIDFVDRLGMAAHLHLQERFDALIISRDGRASRLRAASLPAPWHLLAAFAGYRHLGARSKWRVAQALSHAQAARDASGSFADWLVRNGQREEALRGFWRPFFVPALNAPLERMSAADAGLVMLTAFVSDAGAARFGYSTVPLAHIAGAAARRFDAANLGAPVSSLFESHGDVHGIVLESGEQRIFDGVVLALAPPQLAHLLGETGRYGLPALDGYESFPIVDVHLWHDRGALGFDFAALLDSPVQWIFEKAPGYLCCSMSAADELVRRPSEELAELCWREIKGALPGLAGATLEHSAATRTPQATFMAKPGVARPSAETNVPNLAIAGSWTDTGWPDTMESAVISGKAAARCVIAALGSSGDHVVDGRINSTAAGAKAPALHWGSAGTTNVA